MAVQRVNYRFRQFFSMVLGCARPADLAYAQAKLSSSDLLTLFTSMPRMEKNHGISVCKALEKQGYVSPDLFTAALLHDVGKLEHYPRLWERVFTVLIEYGAPNLASQMALGSPKGLRRGLVVRRFHADWGADLAARAGASYRVLFLIRKHHSAPGGDAELTALQSIDDDGYVSE